MPKSASSHTAETATPKRAYHAKARLRQKLTTQDRILDAALRLFARTGFEATTVRDIAALAGVTHAVIRLHFGTKDALWKQAVTRLFATFAAEVTKTLSPSSGLDDILRRYVLYCARHPEHIRIMMHESMGDSDRLAWMVSTFIAPSHAGIRPVLENAIAAGKLPNVSVVSLIYMISTSAQAIFMLGSEARRLYQIDVSDPKIIEQHVKAVLGVFGENRRRG